MRDECGRHFHRRASHGGGLVCPIPPPPIFPRTGDSISRCYSPIVHRHPQHSGFHAGGCRRIRGRPMQHILKKGNSVLPGLLAAALAAHAASGGAAEFSMDNGWSGSFNNTVSLSSAWRAGNPDSALYTPADGTRAGLSGGTAGNPNDAGNLNYRKNDRLSSVVKLISEFEIKRDDAGALVRAKFWYDQAAKSRNVGYGNMANNYQKNAPLSDSGFEDLQKFSGAYLLDAYIYDTFRLCDKPLQLRLGRQVVNWGESLFVQGVNQI